MKNVWLKPIDLFQVPGFFDVHNKCQNNSSENFIPAVSVVSLTVVKFWHLPFHHTFDFILFNLVEN